MYQLYKKKYFFTKLHSTSSGLNRVKLRRRGREAFVCLLDVLLLYHYFKIVNIILYLNIIYFYCVLFLRNTVINKTLHSPVLATIFKVVLTRKDIKNKRGKRCVIWGS